MVTRHLSLPSPQALRGRRANRLLANQAIRSTVVSLAGLVGRPVFNPAGEVLGRLADIVVRWEGERYPPVTGLVVRVGRRSSFVRIDKVEQLGASEVRLRSGRVDLIGYHQRPGEVALAGEILDRQLVDVDGIRVVRASDLYVGRAQDRLLLVGVDVGLPSLLRRLGPARFRSVPTPDRVIDWGAIQSFTPGDAPPRRLPGEGGVRLRQANTELHRLRPAELADLLEELGRRQRQELLEVLDPEVAADALEEMEPEALSALLREAPPESVATIVAEMEPDEAVEALRELDAETREELLEAMPADSVASLEPMLAYAERTAGGIMTTEMVTVELSASVAGVRQRLTERGEHRNEIDSVLVVDADGRLAADLSLFDLLLAPPEAPLETLIGPPGPVAISPEATLPDVIHTITDNRRSSVVVVDAEGRPLGRILADDVIDALVDDRARGLLLRMPDPRRG